MLILKIWIKHLRNSRACNNVNTWAHDRHLNSLAIQLFVLKLIHGNNKATIKALHYLPFVLGKLEKAVTVTGGFPAQRASNTENISLSWHYYELDMTAVWSFKLNCPELWWAPCRADSRLVPSQWETSLQSNAVSHWLGANLESVLPCTDRE